MAEKFKKQLSRLSKRGPHRVLVGELSYAGLPGKVYAPAEGNGVPAIAFGHDWLTPIKNYHNTLKHLASWGIVVAAPDTETGFVPNHQGFAADLESCLQIVAGVKLGTGNVTVSPAKLGIAGHGMGAGAAVLTAAGRDTVKAVGVLYPTATAPSCVTAAAHVQATGLIIGSGRSSALDIVDDNIAEKLVARWAGPAVYRELSNATQQGFSEGIVVKALTGFGLPQFSAQETARGLLTGFLLNQLDGHKEYEVFSGPEITTRKVTSETKTNLRARIQAAPPSLFDGLVGK